MGLLGEVLFLNWSLKVKLWDINSGGGELGDNIFLNKFFSLTFVFSFFLGLQSNSLCSPECLWMSTWNAPPNGSILRGTLVSWWSLPGIISWKGVVLSLLEPWLLVGLGYWLDTCHAFPHFPISSSPLWASLKTEGVVRLSCRYKGRRCKITIS